jgi:hypothetical protein
MNENKTGKGHFTATPLQFTYEGESCMYAGRGRWNMKLAALVVAEGKAPVKDKDGNWSWREATAVEIADAKKLVDRITAKLQAKADAAAARVAARTSKKGTAPVAVEAAVPATV